MKALERTIKKFKKLYIILRAFKNYFKEKETQCMQEDLRKKI